MAAYVNNVKEWFIQLPLGKQVVAVGTALYCTDRLTRVLRKRAAKQRLRAMRKEYLEWCQSTIKTVEDSLKGDKRISTLAEDITTLPAAEIVTRIQNGQLTAVDVLKCFQAKALEAHKATNCISHFYPEAEEIARAADAATNKTGLLFGLPVSLKDHYTVKGYPSTSGVSPDIEKIFNEDCAIVKVLKGEGAVPFVRTNVPQLMLSFESNNPIFGTVSNPHGQNRGPGGSSSGEGAIVGFGASVMGWGSDFGGSVRVPAAFCGCFGFKPTLERMSKRGMPRLNYGQTITDETFGPLTQDVESLILAMKVMWNGQLSKLDHKMVPTLFQDQIMDDTRPLRVGMYIDDGSITPVPAMYRAVHLAKDALEQRGHTVITWAPPNVQKTHAQVLKMAQADGGTAYVDCIQEDDVSDAVKSFIGTLQKPMWRRKLDVFIAGLFLTEEERNVARARLGMGDTGNWYKAVEKMMDLRDEYADEMDKYNLDVVLAPSWFSCALPLKRCGNMAVEDLYMAGCSYTAMYNALDLPAGVMPVTKVSREDVQKMSQYPKKDSLHEAVVEGMNTAEGLPVAVQVIAHRYQDEYVLRTLKEIQLGLK